MSEALGLGKKITTPQKRDCIHIAVIPVVLHDEYGYRGGQIGFRRDGKVSEDADDLIGVLDPFLTEDVGSGDTVWMYLKPGSITSLRHDWTHPGIPEEKPVYDQATADLVADAKGILATGHPSGKWMHDYALELDLDYDELIDAGRDFIAHEGYLSKGSKFEGVTLNPDFWIHFENITGEKAPQEKRGSFFSCSC